MGEDEWEMRSEAGDEVVVDDMGGEAVASSSSLMYSIKATTSDAVPSTVPMITPAFWQLASSIAGVRVFPTLTCSG